MKKVKSFLMGILFLSFTTLCFGDSTISNLPDGGSAISGTDLTVIVQGGITKKATMNQVLGVGAVFYQPLNANLTYLAGFTPTADVKSILNAANNAAIKSLLGYYTSGDSMSGSFTGALTGNASNLSGTPALPNGTTATTQSAGDNSTKLATTAYVNVATATTIQLVTNLEPVVNAAVNKLDIFTKSGGAVPNATNIISVAIPDGKGYTFRSRAAAYLSGTSQFIMADAANYWSKGSLAGEIKTAYIYAIWATNGGIVWALGGYSGFTRVPASITATDDDFFLLEASSTYTKVITDYCVCVGKIRYSYNTADTPNHTIQATVLDAPQVIWNPKSDYGYQKNLATTNVSTGNITEYSAVSIVVKQTGKYLISGNNAFGDDTVASLSDLWIKTGSSAYASAVYKAYSSQYLAGSSEAVGYGSNSIHAIVYLNVGDTIHLGAVCEAASNNRIILGDNIQIGATNLTFVRVD